MDSREKALREELEDIEQQIEDLETEKDRIEEELDEIEEQRQEPLVLSHDRVGKMGRITYSRRTKLYTATPTQGKGSTKFDCESLKEAERYIQSCWANELREAGYVEF